MLLFCLLTLAASEPEAVAGTVRVVRNAGVPGVLLVVSDADTPELAGDLVAELQRLGSVKVEVAGHRDGHKLVVLSYRIVDLGRGVRPDAVGQLIQYGRGLAVQDGPGEPIALSLPPRVREKLTPSVGGKIWVSGKKLLSGEIKVQQFGVLRDPPTAKPAPSPGGD